MSDKTKTAAPANVFRRNLLLTFGLLLLILVLYVTIPGYNWAITEMAVRNKQLIDRIETRRLNAGMPELTMENKRLFKIEDYWYIQYLRERTPMNAVILLPPKAAIDSTPEFNLLNDPEWVEYFLFPRLCISEDWKNRAPELYKKVTHVAIVNGWGYDHLKYEPQSRPSEAVLSIESPKLDSTSGPAPAFKPDVLQNSSPLKNTVN
ncbi:MAG: hypothetical protein U0T73_02740 [Chitinophagales bacterium]